MKPILILSTALLLLAFAVLIWHASRKPASGMRQHDERASAVGSGVAVFLLLLILLISLVTSQ